MRACACVQILGTVGEPINPEAWRWYEEIVGGGGCPIVDTWWQTETGGHMITPLPGAWAEKPGSATLPFFGVLPAILDPESGKELHGEAEGVLCIKQVSVPHACTPCIHPCRRISAGFSCIVRKCVCVCVWLCGCVAVWLCGCAVRTVVWSVPGSERGGEAALQAWPSTIRGVYGDQDRYEATYFSAYKGYYFSGDGARRDGAPLAHAMHAPSVIALAHPFHAWLSALPQLSGHASLVVLLSVPTGARPPALPAGAPAPQHTAHSTDGSMVRAADGYYWITGRVDDVINVSGHRIGTAEVESALVLNPACAEAAVVGYEHPIKGQGIYAYVTLMDGVEFTDDLRKQLCMCGLLSLFWWLVRCLRRVGDIHVFSLRHGLSILL